MYAYHQLCVLPGSALLFVVSSMLHASRVYDGCVPSWCVALVNQCGMPLAVHRRFSKQLGSIPFSSPVFKCVSEKGDSSGIEKVKKKKAYVPSVYHLLASKTRHLYLYNISTRTASNFNASGAAVEVSPMRAHKKHIFTITSVFFYSVGPILYHRI